MVSAVTLRLAPLKLGSRRSPMAIAQSRQVAGLITERTGRQVEIVGVTTLGDVSRAQLTQIGVDSMTSNTERSARRTASSDGWPRRAAASSIRMGAACESSEQQSTSHAGSFPKSSSES